MVDLSPFFIAKKTKHIITFLPPPPLRSTLSPHPHSPLLHTTSIYDCCIYKYPLYLYYNNVFIKPHNYNYNYKKPKYKNYKVKKRGEKYIVMLIVGGSFPFYP